MDIKTILLAITIALLLVVIYQNEDNEDQILGWVQEYGGIVNSIEKHLIKTDPSYIQIK
tara:strand:+ start:72 stop:248 length:177 start_codon:yes stop_codon:yes gene_type:complete